MRTRPHQRDTLSAVWSQLRVRVQAAHRTHTALISAGTQTLIRQLNRLSPDAVRASRGHLGRAEEARAALDEMYERVANLMSTR